MLTFKRKPGQTIVIGDPLRPLGVIHVQGVVSNKTIIALDFARDVPVNRGEIAAVKASIQASAQAEERRGD